MNCCDPRDIHFGSKHAAGDLVRYSKNGPDRTTHLILQGIREQDISDATLLDVGAGIGVVHHELLEDVCISATHLDLSSAYIEAAKNEGSRRGHDGRVTYIHGDLVDADDVVDSCDIVTLDRVVCCYPDYRAMLSLAVSKCSTVLAMSYPRDRWFVRLAMWLDNQKRKIKGDPFRAFVHPPDLLRQIPEAHGFERRSIVTTPFWQVEVYTT